MKAGPRIIVIGNTQSIASTILLQGLLKAVAKARLSVSVEGIFDGALQPAPSFAKKAIRKVGLPMVRRLFDSQRKITLRWPLTETIHHVARRFQNHVRPLPNRDINHPETVAWLASLDGPVVLISLGVLQVYRPPVLNAVRAVVNFHNGALPGYKGLHANSWELFRRESFAGYTFHYMNPRIDGGNIIIQGRLPVDETTDPLVLEYEKAYRAADEMGSLLEKIFSFDAGTPQCSGGCYFSAADFQRIRNVDNPMECTFADLQHRIRCFDLVYLTIDNKRYNVTRIEKTGTNTSIGSGLQFITKDHVQASATRISFLPYRLRKLKASIKRR